jgi:hypothetical protein
VVHNWDSDSRVTVETFLIGTGLVDRSRPVVRPRRIRLGSVLVGERAQCRLRVRKGRGPGYLFGAVRTSDPWLRVEPRTFRGSLDAVVSVNTGCLAVSRKPWDGALHVELGSGSEMEIPVRMRVVPRPSWLSRCLLRPFVGALAAGLVGMAVAWVLGQGLLATPGWASRSLGSPPLADLEVGPAAFWAAVIGFVGALLGGYRGLEQHPAWSIPHALGRWLLRFVVWGVGLSLVALLGCWSWASLGPDLGRPAQAAVSWKTPSTAALLAWAAAMLPATIGEVRSARPFEAPRAASRGGARRSLVRAGIVLALILFLALGAPLGAKAWQQGDVERAWSAGREFVSGQWSQLHERIDGMMERMDMSVVTGPEREAPSDPERVPVLPPAEEAGVP